MSALRTDAKRLARGGGDAADHGEVQLGDSPGQALPVPRAAEPESLTLKTKCIHADAKFGIRSLNLLLLHLTKTRLLILPRTNINC